MIEEFDKDKLISYWVDSSDKDFKTMEDLFRTNNNHWALFIGHLVIEKIIKRIIHKREIRIPAFDP